MCIIEANLNHNKVDNKVNDCGEKRRQLVTAGVPPPLDQWIAEEIESRINDQVIEQHPRQCLLVPGPVHLATVGEITTHAVYIVTSAISRCTYCYNRYLTCIYVYVMLPW